MLIIIYNAHYHNDDDLPEWAVDEEVGRGVADEEQVAEAGQTVEPDRGHQVLPASNQWK